MEENHDVPAGEVGSVVPAVPPQLENAKFLGSRPSTIRATRTLGTCVETDLETIMKRMPFAIAR